MSDLKKISIIMPVFNSEKYLRDCVNSILSQNFLDFELLLIDDGSTDGSAAICDYFARKDHRVRVFHKENGGICAARNFGLEKAEGIYIAFSDHDDFIEQGFLKENYEVAIEQDADIVKFGRKSLILRDEKIESIDIRAFEKKTIYKSQIKEEFLMLRFKGAMTCVWDGFFKRDFLKTNKLVFDTEYKKGGEDIDFCSKCFAKAEVVVLRNKVYYDHYIRIGYSTSTKKDAQRLLKFERLIANLNVCVEALEIDINKQAELYLLNVMKEWIYPSLNYFKNNRETYHIVKKYLQEVADNVLVKEVSYFRLIKYNAKWGVYTVLFLMKQYRLMYVLLNIHHDK